MIEAKIFDNATCWGQRYCLSVEECETLDHKGIKRESASITTLRNILAGERYDK